MIKFITHISTWLQPTSNSSFPKKLDSKTLVCAFLNIVFAFRSHFILASHILWLYPSTPPMASLSVIPPSLNVVVIKFKQTHLYLSFSQTPTHLSLPFRPCITPQAAAQVICIYIFSYSAFFLSFLGSSFRSNKMKSVGETFIKFLPSSFQSKKPEREHVGLASYHWMIAPLLLWWQGSRCTRSRRPVHR